MKKNDRIKFSNKLKIIFCIFIILNSIFLLKNYAKYTYKFKTKAFSLQIKKEAINTKTVQNEDEKIEENPYYIDNIKPEIIGIEDGKTYNREVDIKYKDNIGIQNIKVFKISNNNEQLVKNPYKLKEDGLYKIIVEDLAGNRNEKMIIIKKPYNINYENIQ